MNIAPVVAIPGYFGVQNHYFATLLAAIGIAWGGLAGDFAAGALLRVLQRSKPGTSLRLAVSREVLPVPPFCNKYHYSQVCFDGNMAICKVLGGAAR